MRHIKLGAIIFTLALAATVFGMTAAMAQEYPGGRGWRPGPAAYGFAIERDIFIPMDDGVRLEARLARPTDPKTGERAAGPFPVLVEFTPYENMERERLRHTFLTERGYIVALVHPRGSGKSGGELQQFTGRDGLDGRAVADWAAKLEGSDGQVGFFGASYPGALALAAAAKAGKDSPIKAVLAASIGLGAQYRQAWTNNGLPTILMQGYGKQAKAAMGGADAAERHFTDFERRFWAGEDPAYDGEFWRERLPLAWARDIAANGIPVLQWGGWQDLNETGAFRGYVAFQNALAGRDIDLPMTKEQKPSPRWQLIVGDWGHAVGMDIGVYLEWFDTWLKGADTGLADAAAPLHLYEAGSGRWVNLGRYPAVDAHTPWHLGEGTLSREAARPGERHLRWAKPEEAEGRLDFESAPVAEGMTIAGPLALEFRAASSNANMAVLARLYDLAPDGKAVLITKGAMLGSLSDLDEARSWKDAAGRPVWPWPLLDRDRPLEPGKPRTFAMALEPIQYGLRPGHRLRLVLTSQSLGDDGGQGFLTAEPAGLTAPQRASVPGGRYTIFLGPDAPATLNIPQLPFGAFPEAKSAPAPTGWNELTRDFDASGHTIPIEW